MISNCSTDAVAGGDGQHIAFSLHDRARARVSDRLRRQRSDEPGTVCRRSIVEAMGHGCSPRTRLWITRAGRDQSIGPSDFSSFGAYVASASSCGVSSTGPRASCSTTSSSAAAPISARSRSTSTLVSSPADRPLRRGQHRPGVELGHDAHDRDAGDRRLRPSPPGEPAPRRGTWAAATHGR